MQPFTEAVDRPVVMSGDNINPQLQPSFSTYNVNDAEIMMSSLGTLPIQDIFPSGRGATKSGGKSSSGNKVAAKYRDSATGQTWTGRGKAPK